MTQTSPPFKRTPPPPRAKAAAKTATATKAPGKFSPEIGTAVRLKSSPEVGVVIATDDWLDTLLLRAVDIADQTLVEWRREGHPIYRWEITSQLEAVPVDTDGGAL